MRGCGCSGFHGVGGSIFLFLVGGGFVVYNAHVSKEWIFVFFVLLWMASSKLSFYSDSTCMLFESFVLRVIHLLRYRVPVGSVPRGSFVHDGFFVVRVHVGFVVVVVVVVVIVWFVVGGVLNGVGAGFGM